MIELPDANLILCEIGTVISHLALENLLQWKKFTTHNLYLPFFYFHHPCKFVRKDTQLSMSKPSLHGQIKQE